MDFEETFLSLMIYIVTFVASCICVALSKKKPLKGFFSFLAICIPSITAAFRECGIDFNAYRSMYNSIQMNQGYEKIEYFWYQLNKVMPTFEWLLFIAAFIFLGMSYYAMCKYIKEGRCLSWFIILTICYSTFYNGMRQMIAVSFVFAAISLFYRKKNFGGVLLIVIAFLFHKSAIFMLLVPICLFLFKKSKHIELTVILLSIFSILGIPIIGSILHRIGIYSSYFEQIDWNLSLGFLLYSIPPLIPYYLYRSRIQENGLLLLSFNLYMLIIPFQFLGMSLKYADRVMLYFQVFIAILVPLVIKEIKINTNTHYNLKLLYVVWFIVQYVTMNIILNGNAIYPYMVFN